MKTKVIDLYYVEALWPCTHPKSYKCSCSKKDFARYSHYAFNDKREPNKQMDGYNSVLGNFEEKNKDVVKKRLQYDPHNTHKIDFPIFKEEKDAIAYAIRLEEVGELACKYSSTHLNNWQKLYSGRIKTRVIHQIDIKSTEVTIVS